MENCQGVETERLVREVLHLTPLLRHNIFRPMERCGSRMGPNQQVILGLLKERGPQTMAQLGRKGLVTRAQGEKDRRTVVVALTPEGEQALDSREAEMARALYPIFDRYTDAQKQGLYETARTMREIMHG